MTQRSRKRNTKYRGTRTCGGGDPKNRRGKGCKGGWGRAGMNNHRFTYVNRYEGKFGQGAHGFKREYIYHHPEITLSEVEKQVTDGAYIFSGKVLGTGHITKKVEVSAYAFTETAKKKIEASGGKVIVLPFEAGENAEAKPAPKKEKA